MSDSLAPASAPALPSGSHPLESSWTIWFDKKVHSPVAPSFSYLSLRLREHLYVSLDDLLILFTLSAGVRLKNGSGRWLRRKLAQVGHVQDFGGVLGRLYPSFARRRAAERLKLSRFSRGYPFLPFFFTLPPLFCFSS